MADSFTWPASCLHDAFRARPISGISTSKEHKTACYVLCSPVVFVHVAGHKVLQSACSLQEQLADHLWAQCTAGGAAKLALLQLNRTPHRLVLIACSFGLSLLPCHWTRPQAGASQALTAQIYIVHKLGVYCKCMLALRNWCKPLKHWQQANLQCFWLSGA